VGGLRWVEGDYGGLLEVPMGSGMDVYYERTCTLAEIW